MTSETRADEPQEQAPLTELPLLTDDVSRIPVWSPGHREWLVRLLLLALAAVLFLPHLGGFGLWDPWETHYGEVTRNMIESYDWFKPWWGFREQIGTERIAGDWFFSKPIYIFWAEASCVKVFGLSEFAIRLPHALLAIAAVFAVYLAFSRLVPRKAAFLMAAVMATAPQFFMIARQAQTDMPFVATMVMAMCAFLLSVFGPRERLSDRQFLARTGAMIALLLLSTVPQFAILATDHVTEVAPNLPAGQRFLMAFKGNGIYHVLIYGAVAVLLLAAIVVPVARRWRGDRNENGESGLDDGFKDRTLRRYYMFAFYIFLAQATLAKGLLGFLLPGFIIGVFLFLTQPKVALRLLLFFAFPPVTWPVLWSHPKYKEARRFEPILGFAMLLVVALPWYVAMFSRFGMAYYTRFFVHDHFNRLEAGVHQIDTGTFEHFVKWLGYGLYPWVVFVPFVVLGFARFRLSDRRPQNHLKLLVFLWAFLSYALFTLAATKFHHYIFPALPPLAILIGWFLWDTRKDQSRLWKVAALIAIGLHLGYSLDIHEEPQQLRNLMTYKYDRPMPTHLPIDREEVVSDTSTKTWEESTFYRHTSDSLQWILNLVPLRYEYFVKFIAIVGLVGLLLFFFVRTRGPGIYVTAAAGALLCLWCLNYYLPMLSAHWSQKYLFEAYYEDCELLENDEYIDGAYTPYVLDMGLTGLFDGLGAHKKRVCREDVISWRLTWRGETYYSYNEIQPINTEETQFEAYLRDRNRGMPFYIFMERGSVSTLQTKLNQYTAILQKKEEDEEKRTNGTTKVRVFREIASWVVETVYDENQYFILGKATPQRRPPSSAGTTSAR